MSLSCNIMDAAISLPAARVKLGRGRRAVPRFDEDVVTMAAEATLDLAERRSPAALVLATASDTLAEGGAASILAELLAIPGPTLQLGGSVAAGAEALIAGMSLVVAGIDPVLAVATDHRHGPDGRSVGAGAAALVLGRTGDGGVLTFEGATSGWFPDVWRRADAPVLTYGDRSFAAFSPAVVAGSGDIVAGPVGHHIDRAGNLGSAGLPAAMILGAPRNGATKRFTAVAGGSTRSFELIGGSATSDLRRAAERVRTGGIDTTMPPSVELAAFDPYASEPRSWRERAQDLRLEGVRDTETGEVFFPPIPLGSGRPLEPCRLRRTGHVVTHTRDHVYPLGDPISMVVVDLDGGGRFYGQTAWDFPVGIGMRVRLVPRLLHRGGGIPHYFWKVVKA